MKNLLRILICVLLSVQLFAQHLKKDGTPDRRYKENKAAYSAPAATHSYSSPHSTRSYSSPTTTGTHLKKDGSPDRRYKENKPGYNSSVKRDKSGKIIRSEAAIREFKKRTGYPHGRPGYIIDHIIPLKDGGCDCPENMQWQTIDDAMAKDKWE